MRVAHVLPSVDDPDNGIGATVLALARLQRSRGVQAEVLMLGSGRGTGAFRPQIHSGVPLWRLPGRSPTTPVRLVEVVSQADIVHVHGEGAINDAIAVLCGLFGRRVVRSLLGRSTHVSPHTAPESAPAAIETIGMRFLELYRRIWGVPARQLLGVSIRTLGREQAVGVIDQAFAAGTPLNVAFVNAHSLNIATHHGRYRSALERFVVLNDGLGINIASRIKYRKPFADNLNGTDFVPHYLSTTRHRLRIYLVGTSDEAVREAHRKMSLRFPRHAFVGARNGFFSGAAEIEETCHSIRASNADCVLVGMGNPLQELWIDEHGAKTGARLHIGVGALLDFQAGVVSRAPAWVRQIHCEWVYRLAQEPRRLAKRYLAGNLLFIGRAILDARR
jgi:alpha-1,3-mannosyltransferase